MKKKKKKKKKKKNGVEHGLLNNCNNDSTPTHTYGVTPTHHLGVVVTAFNNSGGEDNATSLTKGKFYNTLYSRSSFDS